MDVVWLLTTPTAVYLIFFTNCYHSQRCAEHEGRACLQKSVGEQKFLSLGADMYKRVLRSGLQGTHAASATHANTDIIWFLSTSVSCNFLFHVSNTNSADSWCDTCSCIGAAADSGHEDCVTCEEGCQQCLTGQYIIIWMDVCTTSIAHKEIKCIMFSAKKHPQ